MLSSPINPVTCLPSWASVHGLAQPKATEGKQHSLEAISAEYYNKSSRQLNKVSYLAEQAASTDSNHESEKDLLLPPPGTKAAVMSLERHLTGFCFVVLIREWPCFVLGRSQTAALESILDPFDLRRLFSLEHEEPSVFQSA